MENKIKIKNMSFKQVEKLKLVRNGDIGANGKVYKLNSKECLKIFEYYKDIYDEKKFMEFTQYNLETAELPKTLVRILGIFSGYISNYVDGPMLCECGDYDFSRLLVLYSDFIKKAYSEVSELNLIVQDTGSTNIMLDKSTNTFKMIDSDFWVKPNNKKINDIRRINFNNLNASFGRYVCFMFDKYIDINTDYVDFYESYRDDIEKKHNVKIKTINDMRNVRLKGML